MLDLNMIANDLAATLSENHDVDVDASDVLRGLVPFLDTIAPGSLTDAQRFGLSGREFPPAAPFGSPIEDIRTALKAVQDALPVSPRWAPTEGERVTGVQHGSSPELEVTGYFVSSGMDGLSWLRINSWDKDGAQAHLVRTASLRKAPELHRPTVAEQNEALREALRDDTESDKERN